MQLVTSILDTKSGSNFELVLDLLKNLAGQERHVPGTVQLRRCPHHKGKGESVLFPKVLGEMIDNSLHVD